MHQEVRMSSSSSSFSGKRGVHAIGSADDAYCPSHHDKFRRWLTIGRFAEKVLLYTEDTALCCFSSVSTREKGADEACRVIWSAFWREMHADTFLMNRRYRDQSLTLGQLSKQRLKTSLAREGSGSSSSNSAYLCQYNACNYTPHLAFFLPWG
jgi:hypothetical protein